MQQMMVTVQMGVQAVHRHVPAPAGSAAFALQAPASSFSFQ